MYCSGMYRHNGVTELGSDRHFDGVAGFYARVHWRTCGGFSGQRLHQIALACGLVRSVI